MVLASYKPVRGLFYSSKNNYRKHKNCLASTMCVQVSSSVRHVNQQVLMEAVRCSVHPHRRPADTSDDAATSSKKQSVSVNRQRNVAAKVRVENVGKVFFFWLI